MTLPCGKFAYAFHVFAYTANEYEIRMYSSRQIHPLSCRYPSHDDAAWFSSVTGQIRYEMWFYPGPFYNAVRNCPSESIPPTPNYPGIENF